MKNEITCEMIQDLLPSYIDQLTNEVTNEAVSVHLSECQRCKELYEHMQQTETIEPEIISSEIDFLKKTRKKNRMHILVGAVVAAVIVITIFLMKAFFIGTPVDNADLIHVEVTVDEKSIDLSGNLTDLSQGVSDVKYKNDNGVIHITFYETMKSNFHKNDFDKVFESENEIKELWIENRIVWDHGEVVTPEASKLFDTKHDYIGNMSENEETTAALRSWINIGTFKNELQTKAEPYGWKLIAQKDSSQLEQTQIENKMSSYASALIALISNLDNVTFEYTVNGETKSLTIDEEKANLLADQSVKEMAKTAGGLQKLMNILNQSEDSKSYFGGTYVQNSDGTWNLGGITYKYRIVLTGRDQKAAVNGRYVVLTNKKNITYHEVSWSLLSSNSADALNPLESVIVEIGTIG